MEKLQTLPKTKGGSSGAFIYTTHDARLVLKTISTKEKLVLLNTLLNDYVDRALSKDSTMVRILGVFQVQCVGNYSTNLVLMENVSTIYQVVARYDLKGSTFGRRNLSGKGIGKDCNFIETVNKLSIVDADSYRLMQRLAKDAAMLARHNLMDYSLLVTICKGDEPRTGLDRYIYRSTKPGEFYMIALIDFLQQYNYSRRLENWWKRCTNRVERESISVIEPSAYYLRFMKFIESIV